jgi:hypothetical protein
LSEGSEDKNNEIKDGSTNGSKGISRRKFLEGAAAGVVAGAVIGAGIGSLGFPQTISKTVTETTTQTTTQSASSIPSKWDLTADFVVIGAGAAGLSAALAAFDQGASVIVVDMNYDVGGHAICSGGYVDLGGGNAAQQKAGITDSIDLVFQDLTFPKTYKPGSGLQWAQYMGPWQDREMSWVFAQNNVNAFNFLVANGVQFSDLVTTAPPATFHWVAQSGTARTSTPMWNGSTSNPTSAASPAGNGGVGFIRPLEATARSKGVQFLLNYQMTAIYRQQPYSGSVVGISANYTGGRVMPGSSSPLQPYSATSGSLVPNKGGISMTQQTVNIKANKGIMVATGGSTSNVDRRRRCDPRMWDVYQVAGEPYSYQTGDGEIAAQKIGASLWATGNETGEYGGTSQITKAGKIGCQYGYTNLTWQPSSPVFPLARASGLSVANYQDLIEVNMAGVRFADETQSGFATYFDAAMCINAASAAPDWSAGPIWAIFDSDAVTRENWTIGSPNTDPTFFFQGSDIPSLTSALNANTYQTTPMDATTLQNTITRYNSFVDSGVDSDFGKPAPKYKIQTPPYYAGFATPVLHDWLTGLRINSSAQVLDLDGNVIPGLYAAGESIGGMAMHGLAKCVVFGVIAGQNAATGSTNTTISSTTFTNATTS